jgi:hypothetical protein
MALLGHISAAEITTVPTVDALVQTNAHHHHRKNKHKKMKDEEIHGYMNDNDDKTAYDPNVADAPEDMPRTGELNNEHEELHNAKLSPEGYYNGMFHTDAKGHYLDYKEMAQKKHHKKSKRHHARKHPRFVQINNKFDHEHDTDDVVEEFSDETKI